MSDSEGAVNGILANFPPRDIGAAMGLLSRLPVPGFLMPMGTEFRNGAWAYPVIGALIGILSGIMLSVLLWGGVAVAVAVALALGFQLLLTGAIHEDGLADTADGLGGGRSREHSLEIMRDSHIGTYGIAALTISLVARWAALVALSQHPIAAMCVVGTVSRLPMVLVMTGMRHARNDGLSAQVGRARMQDCLAATLFAAVIATIFTGAWFPVAMIAAVLAVVPVLFWASRCLNGQTGDILGACQQCAELAVLALLTIIWL